MAFPIVVRDHMNSLPADWLNIWILKCCINGFVVLEKIAGMMQVQKYVDKSVR